MIAKVRERCPLVHAITNYVTVNDVANSILAIGASPIMSDDINDVLDNIDLEPASSEDDEEYDNITVNIYDNEGDTNFTTAYIRGFYRFQRS